MRENKGITLDSGEHKRIMVLNRVLSGEWTAPEAALALGISERHLRRLKAAYQEGGVAELVHGNRGRAPAHTVSTEVRAQVVALAKGKYGGFNQQHLTEKLAEEEALPLSRSTVRRILAEAGIQTPRPRRAPRHRSRRERMTQEGMLLQADGSRHQWLGASGPYLTLIAGIDDATGRVPWAVFRENEDAQGYMEWLQAVVLREGIPLALYVDRHGIFAANPRKGRSLEEQFTGVQLPTQFGRVLQELRIMLIQARSPQAKGRIERVWGTFQDRLTSELRLADATTLAAAQDVVASFLPRFNQRFEVPAMQPGSAYRPVPEGFVPQEVFCFKYRRTVAADNTISFAPHRLQIQPGPDRPSYARTRVDVHERLDGSLAVYYQAHQLVHRPAPADAPLLRARGGPRSPANPAPATPAPALRAAIPSSEPESANHDVAPPRTSSPDHDHPWRRHAAGQPRLAASLPPEVSRAVAALSENLQEPRASRAASLTRAAVLLARSTLAPAAFLAALQGAEEKTLRAHAAARVMTKQVDGRPKLMAYLFAVLEHDLERPPEPASLLQLTPPPSPPKPHVDPPDQADVPAWVASFLRAPSP